MRTAAKDALRRRLLTARRAVAEHVRAAEAHALADHLSTLSGLAGTTHTVCAYVPVGAEPGGIEMLDALRCRNLRVLLPVARTTSDDVPLALQWGEYRPGQLVPARFGLLEPPQPWLPAAAVAEAGLVLVPALAVDRHGTRLGRGGGYYDRSLVFAAPHTPLMAVVRDDEVLDDLPRDAHDVAMTDMLTPNRGAVALQRLPGPGMPDAK